MDTQNTQMTSTKTTTTELVDRFSSAYSQLCINLGEDAAFQHLASLVVGEMVARKADTVSFERNDGRVHGDLKVTFTGPEADMLNSMFEEVQQSKSEKLCNLSGKLLASGVSTSKLAAMEKLAAQFMDANNKADRKELLHSMMDMVEDGAVKEAIYTHVTEMGN